MKLVAGVILITIAIWLTHNSYLVKISKLEKAVIAERKKKYGNFKGSVLFQN